MAMSPEDRDRLDRLERDRDERRSGRGSGRDTPPPQKSIKNTLITILIAAILVSGLFTVYWVNNSTAGMKSDVDSKISSMTGIVDKAKADLASLQGSVTASVNTIPNLVTAQVNSVLSNITAQINNMISVVNDLKSQVANASSKTDLANANTQITNVNNVLTKAIADNVATDKAQIDALNIALTNVAARITALEAKATATPTPTTTVKSVTATVKATTGLYGSKVIPTANVSAINPSTLTSSFKLTLVNNTNVAVSDISLDIQINTGLLQSTPISAFTLSGGVPWQGMGMWANHMEFVNTQWGLNLAANETKSYYLTILITSISPLADFTTSYYSGGVPYNIDVTVQ